MLRHHDGANSAGAIPARNSTTSVHTEIHRGAIQAARHAVLAMRAADEIGDDTVHRIEEELDWLEMAGGTNSPG